MERFDILPNMSSRANSMVAMGTQMAEALGLVVVLVDRGFGDEELEVARVLTNVEGRNVFGEDGVEDRHLCRVRNGDAFVTILGADAAEVLLLVAKKLDALDDDGVFEQLAPEDGLGENGVELGIALVERAR